MPAAPDVDSTPTLATMAEDVRLHTTRVGDDGERVVFLHGLFGQGKNFTQAAKALQPQFQSLLVDLPNHGRSGWTDRFDYAEAADAVAATVRASYATDGRVHLVGHSMGGKTAMVLALRHPDLVDRLVVVDISPSPTRDSGDDTGRGTGEFEHLLGALASVDLAAVTRRGEADELLVEKIPNPTTRGFLLQNLRQGDDGYRWQANLDLLRRDLGVIGDWPATDEVFDRPVLWMAGEHSDYVGEADEDRMRRLFPRTRLLTVKGAGHWVHSEKPEAFVSALRVFLSADG